VRMISFSAVRSVDVRRIEAEFVRMNVHKASRLDY
jgi:hypothetical protein